MDESPLDISHCSKAADLYKCKLNFPFFTLSEAWHKIFLIYSEGWWMAMDTCKARTVVSEVLMPACQATPNKLPRIALLFIMLGNFSHPLLVSWFPPATLIHLCKTSVYSYSIGKTDKCVQQQLRNLKQWKQLTTRVEIHHFFLSLFYSYPAQPEEICYFSRLGFLKVTCMFEFIILVYFFFKYCIWPPKKLKD